MSVGRTMTRTLPPQSFQHSSAAVAAAATASYGGSVKPACAPSVSSGHPSAAQAAAQSSQKASDLLGAIYSPAEYVGADSKVAKCHWTYETPNEEAHKVHSMLLTNVIRPWIHRHVRVPLLKIFGREKEKTLPALKEDLDVTSAQSVRREVIDPIMAKLPKQGETFDPMWREEARKHAFNIARTGYSEDFVYLAKALKITDSIPLKEAVARALSDPQDSLPDAIACEALRHPVVKKRAEELGKRMDASMQAIGKHLEKLRLLEKSDPEAARRITTEMNRFSNEVMQQRSRR